MKKIWISVIAAMLLFPFTACTGNRGEAASLLPEDSKQEADGGQSMPESQQSVPVLEEPQTQQETADNTREEQTEMKMQVQIGNSTFTATLVDNAAVDAFVEIMEEAPVVIEMSDYSGFEKVGELGTSLPAENSQTTTRPGDIVLYNGSQIVIFYGSNSWSYTRLGKIDDLSGWEEALGSGNVTVIFSIE